MIDKKERKQLKKASAHHSKKHMNMMIKDMKAGLSFTKAHKRAIKKAEEFLTKEEIKNVHFVEIDLSDLYDVRKFFDEIFLLNFLCIL